MSIRVDETKPDTEATEPVIPTTCSPEDLPDEERPSESVKIRLP